MATRKEKDREYLERELKYHREKWLTDEAVAEFQKRAREIEGTEEQITGERRKLCQELMKKYDVLELEAVNIINGNRSKDYVNKYQRIREQRSLDIQKNRIILDEEEDDLYEW